MPSPCVVLASADLKSSGKCRRPAPHTMRPCTCRTTSPMAHGCFNSKANYLLRPSEQKSQKNPLEPDRTSFPRLRSGQAAFSAAPAKSKFLAARPFSSNSTPRHNNSVAMRNRSPGRMSPPQATFPARRSKPPAEPSSSSTCPDASPATRSRPPAGTLRAPAAPARNTSNAAAVRREPVVGAVVRPR